MVGGPHGLLSAPCEVLEGGSCVVGEEGERSRLAAGCELQLVVNGYALASAGE